MESQYADLPLDRLEDVRRDLLAKLRAVNRRIASLADGDGPYVVVRPDDGALLSGRWSAGRRFATDREPFRFIYRTAAEKAAAAHGGRVVPVSEITVSSVR